MNQPPIPFNRPSITGRELEYVEQAVASGHLSGDGTFSKRCHELLSEAHDGSTVLLTPSCTAALEMCALLLQLEPGDEVLVPSFAFVTTANAFAMFGAKPVFCDVDPVTLNLDPDDVERKITARSRAMVALHYGGVACEMQRLSQLASRHGLELFEDNAHGLFGRCHGQPLGTFGSLSTLSFHETKNFGCGEGGALVVNRADWRDRAEILREKGTNRSRFFRGQVDKYTWVDLGSSYLPSELQAAFLFAQLEQHDVIQARRLEVWDRYADELGSWAAAREVQLPQVSPHCAHTAHLFQLLLPSLAERQRFIAHLGERGVQAVFHYQPLHLSDMGQRYGGQPGDCPVTEDVADRLVRLPLFYDLHEEEILRVLEAVRSFE